MAAAVTSSPASGALRPFLAATFTFTGFTGNTRYDVEFDDPNGGFQVYAGTLSDAGGNFTVSNYEPQAGGTLTVTVYPAYDQVGPAGAYDVGQRHLGSGASATLAATTFTVLGSG